MRYIIKIGKYGSYFYDTKLDRNMTLQEVIVILNVYEEFEESKEKQLVNLYKKLTEKEKEKKSN